MVKYCIYKYTNKIDGMAYVGKAETHRFKIRKREHEDPKSGPTMLITKAINKDGWENFKVEILIDNVPLKGLDENFYIERENTRAPHGYNKQRGDGSGSVFYCEKHKKWVAKGPRPDRKFVGYYDTEERAHEALEWFRRTGKRMESDRIIRKRGTGSIRVTKSGRLQAEITWKGKRPSGTFDTEDECEAFFIQIKNS